VKLVCIIHSLDGGGAERVMAALCSRLAVRGHQVTLITLDDGTHDRHPVDPAVQRRYLKVMKTSQGLREGLANTVWRLRKIRQAVVTSAPEVVLSFCDQTNILALLAGLGSGIPIVVSERSDPEQQRLHPVWERLRTLAYRRAARIVALTETSARYLRSRFRVPVVVIPSAVDPPPIHSDRTRASKTQRIIAIGRLEHEKGFDRLIQAFAELPDRAGQWSLQILGEGSQREVLQQQIESLGLSKRIGMPGWIQPIWEELSVATFFVLPSRHEGFPSALMEAMAAGVPSLAVDCESGPRVVLADPTWGLLVPNETAAIRDGMLRMIDDAEFRESLGRSGKQVAERFNWDTMTDAYEALLQRVISDNS
jgi:glycosyltransferase involved in cell wall biosynthesis